MFAATVVFSLLFGAPAATGADSPHTEAAAIDSGAVVQVQEKIADEEGGDGVFDDVMERRYAFSINDDLHPSLEGNLWPFFVGGCCGCIGGQVWMPLLIIGDAPKDFFKEGLITWLFYAIPMGVLWFPNLIPYLNFLYGPAYFVIALAVGYYLVPVNVINTWDRQAKRHGVAAAAPKKKKKKKSSALGLPEEKAFALADPEMAY